MKSKFIVLGILFSFVMLLFLIILIKLQILEHSTYQKQVSEIASRDNVLGSLRGRIFDRNIGSPLAYNVSKYQITIDPLIFSDNREIVEKTAKILEISEKNISEAIENISTRDRIVLVDNLTYDEVVNYMENLSVYKGIYWNRIIKRKYANDNLMSHVIGYVGDISASELQTYSYRGYHNFDIIGKMGVEKEYEELLRGKSGKASEIINVFGKKVDNTQRILQSIEPGKDIILTLDNDIQDIVEKTLGERVGATVVMKPSTGEILAMASYPTYNPNVMVNSLNEKVLSDIQKNNKAPFLNRAIQSTAPPASSFKVVMSTAFLAEDHVLHSEHLTHVVNCKGWIKIGNRIFHCWNKRGHGYVNYKRALELSCNIFFYSIGTQILGSNKIISYANNFGLGQLTRIDLPSEVNGIVPSAYWKELRYNERWSDGDTANLSIGQGYMSVTPLQMASVVSAIVNKGIIYVPHVLKEARDQVTGKVTYTYPKKILKNIDIDENIFEVIASAMRGVTLNGTSSVVMNTDKVQIAGKTGSGQIIGNNFDNLHSWYISYGPYDALPEDKIVVVTWIDATNKWEWWAPKAANIIFEAIFGKETYEEAIKVLEERGTWYL